MVAIAGMLVGYHFALKRAPEPEVRIDTIRVVQPVLDTIVKTEYVTRWMKVDPEIIHVHDTTCICIHDTVPVIVPLETKVYFEEDKYYAEVRGYEAELSYIETYSKTNIEYIEVPRVPRFTFGPTIVAGAGSRGAGWMVGIGGTYNIIPSSWYAKMR